MRKVILAAIAAATVLLTGCSAFASDSDSLPEMGSCSGVAVTDGPIGPGTKITTQPIIRVHGGIGDNVTITTTSDNACIYVDKIGNNVTLNATGKNATIIVLDMSTAVNWHIHAGGQNALVWLEKYPHLLKPGDDSVTGSIGGRLFIDRGRAQ